MGDGLLMWERWPWPGMEGLTSCLEDHPSGCNVVNNHGDRKFPKDRVIPLINGLFMACK